MTNCCCKKPTAEQAKIIEEMLAAPYPVTVSSIAGRLGVTDLEAAELLPEANCTFVKDDITERFTEIWAELASWEKITLFIQHEGSIFEIQGQLHEGKIAQGYYNILAKSAKIGGHMKYDVFSAVAFTTFPFMGRESLAVQFFTKEGKTAFSVFVGRENHQLVESVKEKFIAARAKFSA